MHHPDPRTAQDFPAVGAAAVRAAGLPQSPSGDRPRRGFPDVRCLRCGDPDGAVSIDLHDVCTFTCSQCEAEWTAADVRAQLDGWADVLRWVESAPALKE